MMIKTPQCFARWKRAASNFLAKCERNAATETPCCESKDVWRYVERVPKEAPEQVCCDEPEPLQQSSCCCDPEREEVWQDAFFAPPAERPFIAISDGKISLANVDILIDASHFKISVIDDFIQIKASTSSSPVRKTATSVKRKGEKEK